MQKIFMQTIEELRKEGYSDSQILCQLFNELTETSYQNFKQEDGKRDQVERLIEYFGVSKRIKGYRYLVEAILIYYNNPNVAFTKEVYPVIAEKFDTTASCVERAIRYTIEESFKTCNVERKRKLFGQTDLSFKQKLTNSELIATFSKKIK